FFVFFFFQAEDGIRDFHVTGVQTCALPITIQRITAKIIESKCFIALLDFQNLIRQLVFKMTDLMEHRLVQPYQDLSQPASVRYRAVHKQVLQSSDCSDLKTVQHYQSGSQFW